jgi:hypothetical protein
MLAPMSAAASCGDEPRLRALDFWLGRWEVLTEHEIAGFDVVEAVLDGCAVTERWLDAQGHAGFSLFWFDRDADNWRQLWLTDRALDVAGTKEKVEVSGVTTPTRIRFEGHYPGRTGGAVIYDRTTLTLESPDRVRQLIEISTDGGQSWTAVFDGEYRRAN